MWGLAPELEQKFAVTALKIEEAGGAYYIGKEGDFQYAREGEWLVRDRVGKMQTIPRRKIHRIVREPGQGASGSRKALMIRGHVSLVVGGIIDINSSVRSGIQKIVL